MHGAMFVARIILMCLLTPPLILSQLVIMLAAPRYKRWLPRIYHRCLCWVLNLRVTLQGAFLPSGPLLLVANHSSWLDIVALGSVAPISFVAKSEVERWPVIGFLAWLQGTIFIDRDRRQVTLHTAEQIGQRLEKGDTILIFAEGTTTDGNCVEHFYSSGLGALQVAPHGVADDIPAQPVAIAFQAKGGLALGRHERSALSWVGDQTMLPDIVRIAKASPIDVGISVGAPMFLSQTRGRKDLAQRLELESRRRLLSFILHREISHRNIALSPRKRIAPKDERA